MAGSVVRAVGGGRELPGRRLPSRAPIDGRPAGVRAPPGLAPLGGSHQRGGAARREWGDGRVPRAPPPSDPVTALSPPPPEAGAHLSLRRARRAGAFALVSSLCNAGAAARRPPAEAIHPVAAPPAAVRGGERMGSSHDPPLLQHLLSPPGQRPRTHQAMARTATRRWVRGRACGACELRQLMSPQRNDLVEPPRPHCSPTCPSFRPSRDNVAVAH